LRRGETLEEYVKKNAKNWWEYTSLLTDLYKEWAEGKLVLEDPERPRSFPEFLLRPDYSAWFYSLILITFFTMIIVFIADGLTMLSPLRYVLGTVFVLFLPGYSLVKALYPGRQLRPLEESALSIGLSLALVPLIGLILNYTPWGIRLVPVTISLGLTTTALSIFGAYRSYKGLS